MNLSRKEGFTYLSIHPFTAGAFNIWLSIVAEGIDCHGILNDGDQQCLCVQLLLNLESCYICYSCDFCDICSEWFLLAKKSLLLLRYLRYLRTFRGPSCLQLLLSLESCYISYSCDSCDIFSEWFLLARKIFVTFAIFAGISGPLLSSSFPKS